MVDCYHNFCDSVELNSTVPFADLNFIGKTTQAMISTVVDATESRCRRSTRETDRSGQFVDGGYNFIDRLFNVTLDNVPTNDRGEPIISKIVNRQGVLQTKPVFHPPLGQVPLISDTHLNPGTPFLPVPSIPEYPVPDFDNKLSRNSFQNIFNPTFALATNPSALLAPFPGIQTIQFPEIPPEPNVFPIPPIRVPQYTLPNYYQLLELQNVKERILLLNHFDTLRSHLEIIVNLQALERIQISKFLYNNAIEATLIPNIPYQNFLLPLLPQNVLPGLSQRIPISPSPFTPSLEALFLLRNENIVQLVQAIQARALILPMELFSSRR